MKRIEWLFPDPAYGECVNKFGVPMFVVNNLADESFHEWFSDRIRLDLIPLTTEHGTVFDIGTVVESFEVLKGDEHVMSVELESSGTHTYREPNFDVFSQEWLEENEYSLARKYGLFGLRSDRNFTTFDVQLWEYPSYAPGEGTQIVGIGREDTLRGGPSIGDRWEIPMRGGVSKDLAAGYIGFCLHELCETVVDANSNWVLSPHKEIGFLAEPDHQKWNGIKFGRKYKTKFAPEITALIKFRDDTQVVASVSLL